MSPVTKIALAMAGIGIVFGVAHHSLPWEWLFAIVLGIEHVLVYAASILDLTKEGLRRERRNHEQEW